MVTHAFRRVLWLCMLWWSAAALAAPRATLRLDTDELVVGQTVGMLVLVEDGEPAGVPRIPVDRGLEVRFRQMATNMTIVNGVGSRVIQLSYDLTATEPGTWRIGPAGVTLKGRKTVSISPVDVTVSPASAVEPGSEAPLTVSAGFDVDTAWQGQLVVWKEHLRARLSVASHRWHGRPSDGMLAPQDGRPDERTWTVRDTQGEVAHAVRWWPFIVTEAGTRQVEPLAVEIEVLADDGPSLLGFFQRTRREIRRTEPSTLEVRPLPPAPPDFSGLVGDFQLLSRVEQNTAKVGQSVTWRVNLTGDGALEGVQLPEVGDLDGARVYDGTPEVAGSVREGRWNAAARIEREIVPTREGSLTLPDLELVVFSPSRGEYVTLRAEGATLRITPGEQGEASIQSFAEDAGLSGLDTDTAPIDVPAMRTLGPGLIVPFDRVMPLAWLLAGLPAVGFGLAGLRDRLEARRRARAAHAARRPLTLQERLAQLPPTGEARLAVLEDLLREVAGDDDPHAEDLLAELTRVRFAGASSPDDLDERLLDAIRSRGGRS